MREPGPFIILGIAVLGAALTSITGSLWYLGIALAIGLLWVIFRDTMNVFQWFPWWGQSKRRIYWVARNNESSLTPFISKAFTYHDFDTPEGERYFHGTGIMVSISHWSFQVGIGKLLERRLWGRDIDVDVEEIRKGVDGVWTEGDPVSSDHHQ